MMSTNIALEMKQQSYNYLLSGMPSLRPAIFVFGLNLIKFSNCTVPTSNPTSVQQSFTDLTELESARLFQSKSLQLY